MLTAHTAAGDLVVLANGSSLDSLREWRKHENFYCPQCKEQVLLKAGDIIIPHFAHKQQNACQHRFSEGESQNHLLGKAQLYELFTERGAAAALEPFLPSIRQRPDLLVTVNDRQIPIEFQCSVIPLLHIKQRNDGYETAGMEALWILHTPASAQSAQSAVLTHRLSSFQRSFIQQRELFPNMHIPILLTYNPAKQQFHYISHLIHLQGDSFVSLHSVLPCKSQTLPFALPAASLADVKELARHYKKARSTFLRSAVRFNRRGINYPFLRACYEMGVQPAHLPAWIGIPTVLQEAFKEPDCEWQLLLVAAMRQTYKTPFQLNHSFYTQFAQSFGSGSGEKAEACRHYAAFLREQRIDIYRLDYSAASNFAEDILVKSFLANEVKN